MPKFISRLYHYLSQSDPESKALIAFLNRYMPKGGRILDVGCGYGRHLSMLKAQGFDAYGVEKNKDIVSANQSKGLPCVDVETFEQSNELYDVILLSHIIEHFTPDDLVGFIDHYLHRLKKHGHLIILTPLYSPYFYDDFDHVKPYHPNGLLMVFGEGQAQVQYYSAAKIKLKDLKFRRSPFFPTLTRAHFFPSLKTRVLQLAALSSSIIYRLSFGLIARKDGWIGIFEKVS